MCSHKNSTQKLKKKVLGLLLSLSAFNVYAAETVAPAAPTWGLDPVTGTLLLPGINVNTMGVLATPRAGDGDYSLRMFDVRGATLSPTRPVQNPDIHLHHNWDMGSIGNVFGLAIDNNRNIYTSASTHYGSYYGFEANNAADIRFGSIGAGTAPDTAVLDDNPGELNDLSAAGAVYKLDAVTGNASVFATLPQTATSFSHEACEGGPAIPRNTGPALGNVAYDKVRNNLYVSNFEDGRIYLFDAGATIPPGGFTSADALSIFDPVGFDGLTSADQASPYGLAVSPDGTKLYYGTHEINKNPQLFAVNLNADGTFNGAEIDQNAQLVNDLQYTQDIGGVFSSDGAAGNVWISYSDLNFSPDGELIIGLRTGCNSNFATSHNHGGTYYLLKQDAGGLYNTPADKVPGTGTTYTGIPDTVAASDPLTRAGGGRYDAGAISIYSGKTGVGAVSSGPDDGYGGIAIYDKGDGTYDYLATSSDMTVEAGPHGFMLFPHNFTLDTSDTAGTNLINPLASFPSLPSSTTAAGQDYKGIGGDIEVLSVLVDWGDAPDTYSTDLITGNATGGTDVKGPTHIITAEGIILGATVDNEFNGVPSVGADGDDNANTPDDEDGISAFPELLPGATSYTIPIANISAANSSGGDVTIHAWIDFDGNGTFDPDEYTTTTVADSATAPNTALSWSGAGVSGINGGTKYARFRITNDASINANTPGGPAANGEVEDYAFSVPHAMSIGSVVWEDTDLNGLQGAALSEPRISGALVNLLVENGAGAFVPAVHLDGSAVSQVTTGADGEYIFTNLPEGDYKVTVEVPANYVASPTQNATGNADADGVNDSNIDTALTVGNVYTSGEVTLSAGNEPTEAGGFDGDDLDNSLIEANGNMTVDFGFAQTVSIGSYVWNDANQNGIQEAGELPVTGAVVTLVDSVTGATINDKNGVPATTSTTATGLYFFDELPPGTYKVRVDPPAGHVPSPVQNTTDDDATENDSNIVGETAPSSGIYESASFSLAAGSEPTEAGTEAGDNADNGDETDGNMTVDFGFYVPVVNPVSIGSVIWNDTNNNGIQETGEVGIPGATVTLLDGAGTPYPGYASVTTGSNGQYLFDNLPAGSYQIQVQAPAGFVPSANQVANADGDADNDSNVASSVGNLHTSGTVILTNDGEPSGVNEAGVAGGDDQDTADDNNGNMTVDFGFYQALPNAVSIGSVIWDDNNDNGKQDDGETGIAGATVMLLDGAGVPVPGVASVTTDASGLYYFANLPAGDYQIKVTPPAGYTPSTQQTSTNSNVANDSNIAVVGTGPDLGSYTSATFTLANDAEVTEVGGLPGTDDADNADEDNGNMTVDFGFYQAIANPVSVGSLVWNDSNFNGIQDGGELGVAGATVTLLDSLGVPVPGVAPQVTGLDGLYNFGNLPAGMYQISVVPPAGFVPTFVQEANADGDVANDSNIATTNAGEFISGVIDLSLAEPTETGGLAGSDDADGTDATTEASGNMTVDFGFVDVNTLGAISGNVSQDVDGDGLIDFIVDPLVDPAVDLPIPNVLLQLLDNTGNPVLDPITGEPITTLTDANGDYLFDNLPPGDYQVLEVQPGGFLSVSDVDGNDQNDSIGDGTPITVNAGATTPGNDFVERRDPDAIPTLSEWALFMLIFLLGFIGYRQSLSLSNRYGF